MRTSSCSASDTSSTGSSSTAATVSAATAPHAEGPVARLRGLAEPLVRGVEHHRHGEAVVAGQLTQDALVPAEFVRQPGDRAVRVLPEQRRDDAQRDRRALAAGEQPVDGLGFGGDPVGAHQPAEQFAGSGIGHRVDVDERGGGGRQQSGDPPGLGDQDGGRTGAG
ncbi:hypothetical protein GCM10017566_34470 [Amycolatopsis bartoniae]|uniref:Uncharacterized protein n=1 Tax=Amycolatopsis bartoniae TaxID=941986 RepID=A0A8H9ITD8_9PSEU|nr:hypothetical protein GCM10017566_34470 [Amycolatopsis bartoniae]